MKKLKFTKNTATAAVTMLILFLVALGCSAEKPSAPPTEAEAQTLVKSTMTDFANAIDKGDFAAFKTNTSKEFQSQFTDDQLKTTFKALIDAKETSVPLLREAAGLTPKFNTTPPPVREEKGYSILTAAGTFDTDSPLSFSNEYVYQDGKWKLLSISFK